MLPKATGIIFFGGEVSPMSPQKSEIHKRFGHLKTKLFAINTSKKCRFGVPMASTLPVGALVSWEFAGETPSDSIQEIRSKNQLERRKMTYFRFDSSWDIITLEVNHHFKKGGSFWKMINPY